MPRKLRVEYEGAIYHVMARGNDRGKIVKSEHDRNWFVETLGEACERAKWKLHAFVLMRNHYHLMLETPQANLVDGMRWLQTTWTVRYNTRNRHGGHLFQGRYKAIPVEADGSYLLSLANYIHLNPLRARLINLEERSLESYQWSSYPSYLRKHKPDWLCRSGVLTEIGGADDSRGRLDYKRHVQRLMVEMASDRDKLTAEEEWNKIRNGWHFGSESFAAELIDRFEDALGKGLKESSVNGEEVVLAREISAERQLKVWLNKLKMSAEELTNHPKGCDEKCCLVYMLKTTTTMSNEWISERVKIGHPANIPRLVKRVRGWERRSKIRQTLQMLECED